MVIAIKNSRKVLESEICELLIRLLSERHVPPEQIARLGQPEGKNLLSDIADTLAKELIPVAKLAKPVPAWLATRVGCHKNAAECQEGLDRAGVLVSCAGVDIIEQVGFSPDIVDEMVEFVLVSGRELGLIGGITREQIERAALEFDLVKCQPWDAPFIRNADPRQPRDTSWLVMMDPVTGSHQNPSVFRMASNFYGVWLDALCVGSDDSWSANVVWVFRRRPLSEVLGL